MHGCIPAFAERYKMSVIPRLDRGIQKTYFLLLNMDRPVKPDDDKQVG